MRRRCRACAAELPGRSRSRSSKVFATVASSSIDLPPTLSRIWIAGEAEPILLVALPGIVAIRGVRRDGDGQNEHRAQWTVVSGLDGDPAGLVVDVPLHNSPVELPPGIARDTTPEHPLSAAVAFAEGVNVVELVVVVGKPFDELVATHASQFAIRTQLLDREAGSAFDQRDREKEL